MICLEDIFTGLSLISNAVECCWLCSSSVVSIWQNRNDWMWNGNKPDAFQLGQQAFVMWPKNALVCNTGFTTVLTTIG
jgi:hypothetical protein